MFVIFADLGLYTLVGGLKSGKFDHVPATLTDSYPAIKAHFEMIGALPAVAEWNASHAVAKS